MKTMVTIKFFKSQPVSLSKGRGSWVVGRGSWVVGRGYKSWVVSVGVGVGND